MCNCKWTEIIIALVVIIFTLWQPGAWAMWLVVIAGAVLLIHALVCKNCGTCAPEETETKSPPKKRRRKK